MTQEANRIQSQGWAGGAPNQGVDVKYENSGTTTIRISGSPVAQSKQRSEPGTQQHAGTQSENNNRVVLSSGPPHDSTATEYNSSLNHSSTARRKKVSFLDTVVVNDCNGVSEITNTRDVLNDSSSKTPSPTSEQEVRATFTDDPPVYETEERIEKVTAANAKDIHPVKNHKVKKSKKKQNVPNGDAVPIVDEYEIHELSTRLSSKDNVYAPTPVQHKTGIPEKPEPVSDNGNIRSHDLQDGGDVSDESAAKETTHKDTHTKATKKHSKRQQTSKKTRCRLKVVCLAIGGVLLMAAICAVIVLALLLWRQNQGEPTSEIVDTLTSRLQLRYPGPRDLFVKASLSMDSQSNVYYLAQNNDFIPWQRPNQTATLSWHRGTTFSLYSIRMGQWEHQKVGDAFQHDDVTFSVTLSPDTWYAGRLEDTSDSYVLVSTFAGTTLGWIQSTNLGAQFEDLQDKIEPFNRPT